MRRWNRQHELVGHEVLVYNHGTGWVVGVDNQDPLRIRVLVKEVPVNTREWVLIQ